MPSNEIQITGIMHIHPDHLERTTQDSIKQHSIPIRSTEISMPNQDETGYIDGTLIGTGTITFRMPHDLVKVLRFAKHRGCCAVLITDSAEPIEDLPVFKYDPEPGPIIKFASQSLRVAYDQAAMKPADFPAKVEVQYSRPNSGDSKIPDIAIFDVQDPQEISDKWVKYCNENRLHKDSVTGFEMLCRI